MRIAFAASSAGLTAFMLAAGCSGAPLASSPSVSAGARQDSYRSMLAPLAYPDAVAAGLARLHFDQPVPTGAKPAYSGLHDLYVADYGVGTIVVLSNQGYSLQTRITDGISGPEADDLDTAGNLYVANAATVDITQYAPGALSPAFTYSASMIFPIDVAVDRRGHVFEADYGGFKLGDLGFVNEYAQQSNIVLRSCPTRGRTEGIAIDAAGDVFVSYNTARSGGKFVEYKGGLAGCKPTHLHVLAYGAGGIALDKDSNLIVVDQVAGRVKVFPPPYRHDQRRLGSGYYDPFHVRINRRNGLVFVSDAGNATVYVINYATGRILEKLNYFNAGFTIPFDAVDGPNAVY